MKEVKKALCALGLLVVIASGIVALTTNAEAKKPELLCGPTILYECTFRDGSTELVGLTVCELKKFEKKNKATCVPYGG
jgi:hypothetical protein